MKIIDTIKTKKCNCSEKNIGICRLAFSNISGNDYERARNITCEEMKKALGKIKEGGK